MFTNLCLVPLLLFIRLGKWSDIVQFGRWRDLVKSFPPPLPGLVLNPLEETLLQPVLKTFITVLIIMKGWKINLQELRF